jgi:hypothetical protein
MAMLGSDGTVVLSAGEAAQLRAMVDRWEAAARMAGADCATPLVDLGDAVRNLLTGLPLRWRPEPAVAVNLDRAVLTKDAGVALVKDRRGRAWLSAGDGGNVLLDLQDAQELCRWLAAWIREQP